MVAYTTTYNLKKPTVADDEDVWGGYLNDSMDLIDDVLDGTTPVTGIDINSGTIDNTVIGGTTPVAGTFTALTANTSLGVTGNITVSGTVDGVDIATRDGVLTTTTTTANAALPKAGGTMTGAITFAAGQTFDGRDVSADGAKLDGIESGATADQTKADIDALGIAASTAATLATARNISLSGDVSGSASFNGSANISITATVADDSHNHVISNVDGLQTALDGKLSTSGKAADANLLDGLDLHTGRNNQANKVVRTNSSGYADFGWINTTSGDTTSGLSRAYVDTGDGYIRKCTLAHLASQGGYHVNGYGNNMTANQALADDWFRSIGSTGWYNNTYGGGIYMTDSTWVQVYNGKQFLVNNKAKADSWQELYTAKSGTSVTIDADTSGAFSLSMSGNTTFTFSSVDSSVSVGFVLQLTGNGSTVTWPSSVDWAGGTAPDAPASGETDIYVFWTRDGGTTWYGVQSIDAAA